MRSVYAEGESGDSNPVIASLSNSLSRDSSLLTTPHSSFPPSPEKSVVTMTIKEEDEVVDSCDHEPHQTDHGVKQDSIEKNLVDDLVKENLVVEEDTYSAHTTSSSGSSLDATDATNTVHELRNTFTVVQESSSKEQHDGCISPQGNPHDTVLQKSSHENMLQENPHNVSEGNPHNVSQHDEPKGTTTTQDVNATRENPQDVPSDNVSQLHSHCNSLESLHSILTTSSGNSPVTTPTSSHSPKFHQLAKQRRSFFPPIMDFSENKSTDDSLQDKNNEITTSSSKELATELLSALEKELSNPLLKPTTCT